MHFNGKAWKCPSSKLKIAGIPVKFSRSEGRSLRHNIRKRVFYALNLLQPPVNYAQLTRFRKCGDGVKPTKPDHYAKASHLSHSGPYGVLCAKVSMETVTGVTMSRFGHVSDLLDSPCWPATGDEGHEAVEKL